MIATNTAIIAGEGGVKPNVPLPGEAPKVVKTIAKGAKSLAEFIPAVAVATAATALLQYFGSHGPTYAQMTPQQRLQSRYAMPLGKTTVNLTLHSQYKKGGR